MAAPPDVLYRLVTKGVRQCYPTQQIDSEYFPDNRTARVAMSSNTGINIVAVMVADIEPAQPGSSVRVAYVRGGASFAEGVERWSRGDYTSCPFML